MFLKLITELQKCVKMQSTSTTEQFKPVSTCPWLLMFVNLNDSTAQKLWMHRTTEAAGNDSACIICIPNMIKLVSNQCFVCINICVSIIQLYICLFSQLFSKTSPSHKTAVNADTVCGKLCSPKDPPLFFPTWLQFIEVYTCFCTEIQVEVWTLTGSCQHLGSFLLWSAEVFGIIILLHQTVSAKF